MKLLLQSIVALMLLLLTGPLASRQAVAGDPSAAEVQSVISAQIEAFRHDDGATAYSFAGSGVQALFPSVDAFMAMVRSGYAPVYRPQHFEFSQSLTAGDRFVQDVDIIAADGTAWTAEYTLARDADGHLKIEGCVLVKRPGIGA
jgi:acyl-CoA thioesterase FadM